MNPSHRAHLEHIMTAGVSVRHKPELTAEMVKEGLLRQTLGGHAITEKAYMEMRGGR